MDESTKALLLQYLPIAILLIAALGVGIIQIFLGSLLGPKKPTKVKLEPYECGIKSESSARVRFSVKFSLVALLFLLFDVEFVFILLWAVVFQSGSFSSEGGMSFQMFAFLEMMVFIVILLAGYAYAWKKGALDWS
jgi:NADH-quinone oxidoreductase subunit A